MIKQKQKNEIVLIKDHKPNVQQEGKTIRKTGRTVTKHKDDVQHIENQLVIGRALDAYSIEKQYYLI